MLNFPTNSRSLRGLLFYCIYVSSKQKPRFRQKFRPQLRHCLFILFIIFVSPLRYHK